MNTSEIRQSEIKGFLRFQQENGGIVPSKLKDGQEILLETNQYAFKFTVLDTPAEQRRYIVESGSPICRTNHVCIDIRAHSSKLKYEIEDWIGKGMRLILKFTNGNSILIGEVQKASIIGKREDGSEYTFEFWEQD